MIELKKQKVLLCWQIIFAMCVHVMLGKVDLQLTVHVMSLQTHKLIDQFFVKVGMVFV